LIQQTVFHLCFIRGKDDFPFIQPGGVRVRENRNVETVGSASNKRGFAKTCFAVGAQAVGDPEHAFAG
jgi:hypothetical protein